MTNNQLTDAQISNATLIRLIRWADEHNSHYVAAALRELQERRKAAMDSEPVKWINGCNKSVPAALRYLAENPRPIGGESSFNTAHLYQLAREIESMSSVSLYRHAQPAPVVPDGLLSMAASAIEDLLEHTDPNTSYYSGVWADVPGKLRAAMIAAAPQEVKP
ncbi:hypothetical protein [Raoultella planticola]|uniref:hypothetical protein n=1 Tax=Raoultella planticola TaxID=575 RepID=UPI001BD27B80|nr:hypothetical protein [Raoultella planticola]